MFCNKCGAQLPDGVAFCSYCGNQLTPQPQQPEQPTQPQYEQPTQPLYQQPVQPQYDQPMQQPYQPAPMPQPLPPKKSNKGLIIGIVAAILVIAIVVGVLFGTGVIGGKSKDDSEDKDNKTTTSAQDKEEDVNSNSTVKVEEAITLSDGTVISIGDNVGSLKYITELTVELYIEDLEAEGEYTWHTDANLDTVVAPGQEFEISFDSETFDYTTIEVGIVAKNNTSSDIAAKDAEIISIELEKDESYADETKVNLMGFTTNMTSTDVENRLKELGYTCIGDYQEDAISADEEAEDESYNKLMSMSPCEYISIKSDEEYVYYVKTENNNGMMIYTADGIWGDKGEPYCNISLMNNEEFMSHF